MYGGTGVCEVLDITTVDYEGMSKDRLYYVLHPYDHKAGKIFTPVDSHRTSMRGIISKEEANELIDSIPTMGNLWIADERLREKKYKEYIRNSDCRELMQIIKTLYFRKQERVAQGKKITALDERYLKMAEEILFSELAFPLEIPKNEMKQYIEERIGLLELN